MVATVETAIERGRPVRPMNVGEAMFSEKVKSVKPSAGGEDLEAGQWLGGRAFPFIAAGCASIVLPDRGLMAGDSRGCGQRTSQGELVAGGTVAAPVEEAVAARAARAIVHSAPEVVPG